MKHLLFILLISSCTKQAVIPIENPGKNINPIIPKATYHERPPHYIDSLYITRYYDIWMQLYWKIHGENPKSYFYLVKPLSIYEPVDSLWTKCGYGVYLTNFYSGQDSIFLKATYKSGDSCVISGLFWVY